MKATSEGRPDSRGHGSPRPASIRSVVWVLSLGAFASSGMSRVLDPMLPRLENDFGLTLSQLAWALTAFTVAYGVMQMFYGPVADRRGKLFVLRWASVLAAVAAAACIAGQDSFLILVSARALAGAFCAASIPLAIAWIGDNVPFAERKTVLARFMLGQMLGMASGQALGGLAAEQALWSWPFAFYAVIYAAVAVALAAQDRRAAAPTAVPSRLGPLQGLMRASRDPYARRVLLAAFAEGFTFLGAFAFVATHIHKNGATSLSIAGMSVMGFSAGGVVFALLAMKWIARRSEAYVIRLGGLLAAAGMAIVAWFPSPFVAASAMALGGVGFYMLHNTLQAHATQILPAQRGAAIAIFATSFFLGQSVGVATMGAVTDHLGSVTTMLVGAGGIFLVALGLRNGLDASQDDFDKQGAGEQVPAQIRK